MRLTARNTAPSRDLVILGLVGYLFGIGVALGVGAVWVAIGVIEMGLALYGYYKLQEIESQSSP
jgi:hypothetical protein